MRGWLQLPHSLCRTGDMQEHAWLVHLYLQPRLHREWQGLHGHRRMRTTGDWHLDNCSRSGRNRSDHVNRYRVCSLQCGVRSLSGGEVHAQRRSSVGLCEQLDRCWKHIGRIFDIHGFVAWYQPPHRPRLQHLQRFQHCGEGRRYGLDRGMGVLPHFFRHGSGLPIRLRPRRIASRHVVLQPRRHFQCARSYHRR